LNTKESRDGRCRCRFRKTGENVNRFIAALWITVGTLACGCQDARNPITAGLQAPTSPPGAILEYLGRGAFQWFQDARWEPTGMVADRWPNRRPADVGEKSSKETMASIASLGYFLSVLPDAVQRGWIRRAEAVRQAKTLLDFANRKLEGQDGLFYHFVDWKTGRRWRDSEVSALDSAIFLNGCMVAAEGFPNDDGGRVADLANSLIDGADWSRFLTTDARTGKALLSFGWTPEKGLLGPMDVRSSEMAMPYFLAVGSRTHSIDPRCWYNTRVRLGWHGLAGMVDKDGVDFEGNAREAALANRECCRRLGQKHSTFRPEAGGWWGISAGDSARGYVAAGPLGDPGSTVWPTAALAAVPYMPEVVRQNLPAWRASKAWGLACGHYGLAPFDLDGQWVGQDLIGIDVGSFLVSFENLQNDAVHRLWSKHPVAVSAFRKLGYRRK
jgi:hypothetical protein